MSREMARHGHRVSICTTIEPGAVSSEGGLDCGVELRGARAGRAPYGLSTELVRLLTQSIEDADIVHIHGLYRFHLPAAVAVCRRYQVPLSSSLMAASIRSCIGCAAGASRFPNG